MYIYRNERGFTLPELCVVTGVIVVFAAISIVLLRPKSEAAEAYNGQRTANIAMIAQALQRYKSAHGYYPPNIPDKSTGIGSIGDMYPLCKALVPEFLPDLPTDPQAGSKYRSAERMETLENCNAQNVDYDLGYNIMLKNGALTLSAPNAQAGQKIELTID